MELYLILGVTLIATIIATSFDIKYKYVPDLLNYFLIIFGIGANLILAIMSNSPKPIIYSLIGAAIFYGIGAAFYYTGVWGGGDAKLLTGYGATLATIPAVTAWPFLVTTFLNILTWGAVIGIFGTCYLALKHYKKFTKEMRILLSKFKLVIISLYILLVIVVLLFIMTETLAAPLLWGTIVILFYLFLSLKAVENCCMFRKLKPSELQEGDWFTEPVTVKGSVVYEPERSGLSRSELQKLRKLEAQGKLKTVTIKDGIQYVPAFLLALITSMLGIDLMFYIFSLLL
ncbi:prepilin peptidase [Candidatus Woesearchaeota archaeon]|jgi:Flp pilus assembly protein protease CpaA|nr:prepilin peptidase [Candidatus Woesearchaeota archaeon]MBT4114599.1 prepilin peptidase [Candidatus Woesearchaeota archaeon]MBT4248480.1 prepilin peptidase [Candidatus Woesearchaeota archaeon]